MAASQQGGPIDNNDIEQWKTMFNEQFGANSKAYQSSAPDARPWQFRMWEFWNPFDTCLITCCVPCVTFGKTHHRMHKGANLENYSPINTTCLGFCVGSFCCINLLMSIMQRSEMRKRYNLGGSMAEDALRSLCCGCCTLVQNDKEAEFREKERSTVMNKQYAATEQMQYGAH